MTHTTSSRRNASPFSRKLLLGGAALVIVLAGLRSMAEIVGPVFLALVLVITLHPLRARLERTRLPGWATSLAMLLSTYVLMLALTLALVVSVAQLAALVPQYTADLKAAVADAGSSLTAFGVDQEQIDSVVGAIDPGQLADFATSLLSNALGVVTDVFFLLTVLLFVVFDTDSTRRSLSALENRFPDPVRALGRFASGTRNYMVVSATFGLIVAVIDGLILQAMGIPGAFVWAVLAFVTNFIPNIGFIIGLIPPAIIALLESGPALMLAVVAVYSLINFVIQSVIQPRVVGDKVGLSPSLTFLSLVFWAWLMGPIGALLAVPFSLLARALLVDAEPSARWALALISGKASDGGIDPATEDAA